MRRILLLSLLTGMILASCFSETKKSKNNIIFVSILPLKYFADKIVDSIFKVEVTVPPGVGPETYSPTPKQMILLSKAKAYFSIGYLGFEQAWLQNFQTTNPNLKVIVTSKNIDLIKEKEQHGDHLHLQGVDPHIWSSPKEARIVAQNIFNGILQIDPEKGNIYRTNFTKLLTEIDRVDSIITALLIETKMRKFIIFHPALGYFARDYGFEQLSIEFEGKVPSPKHLETVIESAKTQGIKFVLIQREFDKENAEIIAKETGCKIIQIDPLDYNWPVQMIEIAKKLSSLPK